MWQPSPEQAGMRPIARGWNIVTSSSHILSSHRARCSAQCVGDASVGRATEQGTNVLLSDRSQCGNSVVLCNAPAAAAGSAALEA